MTSNDEEIAQELGYFFGSVFTRENYNENNYPEFESRMHGNNILQNVIYLPRTICEKLEVKRRQGSFRVNSTNFCKSSQVSVSNIALKIPKITLVSIVKACQILGCNSEYFWRYSLSNFLFYIAFLPSRLKC